MSPQYLFYAHIVQGVVVGTSLGNIPGVHVVCSVCQTGGGVATSKLQEYTMTFFCRIHSRYSRNKFIGALSRCQRVTSICCHLGVESGAAVHGCG